MPLLDRLGGASSAHVVARDELVECLEVVPAAAPRQIAQIDRVADPEVLKRLQKAAIDRLPHSQLDGDATAEPPRHIPAVHALRRGCQAKQFLRLHVFE